MKRAAPILSLYALGCSGILDFETIEKLPCECLPSHICLRSSNRCVPRESVDNYKSCPSTDAADDPDALCKSGSICVAHNDKGPRCLPQCEPTNFTTAAAGLHIAEQCASGTLCWDNGVCDVGQCDALDPNACGPGMKCVAFNGAGRCFTLCNIFEADACGAPGTTCHLVGDSEVTACLGVGERRFGQICTHKDACAKYDLTTGQPRPMICSRPEASQDQTRCWPTCRVAASGNAEACLRNQESCQFVRPRVDPVSGDGLGVCVE